MINFPTLKTGAVAQYPARKTLRFRNQILRFVDGTDQRYRDSAGPLHTWEINLDKLDDAEMAVIEAFFAENQGNFGNFAFTDPWDGQVYSNCSLASDSLSLLAFNEMQGTVALKVVENRS
jgi:Conserved hypothetical protein 2217 (DUF2460)